jgi:hypothetical protein
MKRPYAYVLYVEHGNAGHEVFLYQTMEEAEEALRNLVRKLVVGHCRQDEIVLTLEECGVHVRIFACTAEFEPFVRGATAA